MRRCELEVVRRCELQVVKRCELQLVRRGKLLQFFIKDAKKKPTKDQTTTITKDH